MINDARVKREDALDSDAEAGLAHSDGFAHAAVLARDDYAFKSLYAFLIAFFGPHVNANRIARLKIRNTIA